RAFSSIAGTSQPSPSRRLATADPTRPQPMTIAFTFSAYRGKGNRGQAEACPSLLDFRLRAVLFEDTLREGDHEHLAGGAAEHVLDRRREEARLPAPARRGA